MHSTIYLNIGSNQGDRRAHIEQAVALIAGVCGASHIRLSSYYESAPWGYASNNYYLNLGVAVDTDATVDPHDILRTMQRIQHSISAAPHRDASGNYCDRPIDIDVIAIDKKHVDDETLQLPHPRAWDRPFVMEPLREVAPPDVVDFVRNAHK